MVLSHKSASAQALVVLSVGEQGKRTRTQDTLQIKGTWYEHMRALVIKVYPENVHTYTYSEPKPNKWHFLLVWFLLIFFFLKESMMATQDIACSQHSGKVKMYLSGISLWLKIKTKPVFITYWAISLVQSFHIRNRVEPSGVSYHMVSLWTTHSADLTGLCLGCTLSATENWT